MRITIEDFVSEIDSLIPEVEEEIMKRKTGIDGDGNLLQLEFIKSELEEIRTRAVTNSLPPKSERHPVFLWHVIDEWNLENPLGRKLSKLAGIYLRKI